MTTALVTDSNSQLPVSLIDRYSMTVVPITVIVNGTEYQEGIDLDADLFYSFFESGAPEISTSQPSPGAFAEAYQRLADEGHDRIISIHVTESMSGTLNSARMAAAEAPVPIDLVDSGTASFGLGCCAWEIGQALADDRSADEAIARATSLADGLYHVTALGAADLLEASGRLLSVEFSDKGVDVFRGGPNDSFDSVGAGETADEICDLMATTMHCDGAPIRVALGIADQSAAPYYEGLETRLADRDDVVEIVRYRIGPSVGAFTGPGTAGGFWYEVS